jgi:AraC-like DNA-binding protein
MAKVWQKAAEVTGDDCIALTVAKYFQPNMYSAPGIAIAASRTGLEGLERCLRYFKLTTDAAEIDIIEKEGLVQLLLTIPEYNQPISHLAVEAYVTTMVSLFRMMMGDDFAPVSIDFTHPATKLKESKFTEYFRCPIQFDTAQTQLSFNKSDLQKPQFFANPAVAAKLDEWMEELLQRYDKDLMSTSVKSYILEHLLLGKVELEQVAEHLNMGLRTLQRKLKAEGKNFNELLDECRHHLATKLVAERKLPLIEVAFMLGFADQSSFTRAFKRWTGISPTRYIG